MLSEYILHIDTQKNKASLHLRYKNGYLKRVDWLSGKMNQAAHESLMKIVPQMENVILLLELEYRDKGISWEKIKKINSLHQQMMDVYHTWYEEYTKLKPRIIGSELAALKQIRLHLTGVYQSEAEVLNIWKSIFEKWNDLRSFQQSQTELRHINQSLNLILRQIGQVQQAQSLDDKFKNLING